MSQYVFYFIFVVKGISQYVLGCRIKLLKREYCLLVYTLYEREGYNLQSKILKCVDQIFQFCVEFETAIKSMRTARKRRNSI